ncbi:hypothetical protein AXF42_Ash008912 [Apostasia shenzhenica]|uniref:Crt like 1 n=1 Tax=Apostasia shenzhenica TaxID=1088818 RepID=A0A2I0ASU8_9ASPA|nr:hypothetical protein AXF42_Ash008912 [Apostasia shenzhenica]
MYSCCRPSTDLTFFPSEDRLRPPYRRPISALAPSRWPAAAAAAAAAMASSAGGSPVLEAIVIRCAGRQRGRRRRLARDWAIAAIGEAIGGFEQGGEAAAAAAEERRRRAEVVAAAAMTAVLGSGNRVMYKLALVPLKQYPFFLAQLATFGYVVVYFSILYCRYQAGIVTDEMLSVPKTPFLFVGLLEALGAASGMAAGAVLLGAWIPILSQTFLVWQLILSFIFLGRRYRANQVIGCLLVSIGVIITVASGSGCGLSLQNVGIFWALLMIVSFFFQAADTVLKEIIFLDSAKQLKGGSVDLFVVNSFGSAFQAIFICLLLPFLSKLWGISFYELPGYIKDGAACFLHIGKPITGCEGAPMLPLLFVMVNMAFNISMLHLLKISSAVVSCLASTFSVPLSIYAFTLPLPFIGAASPLPARFMLGAAVLIAGLLIYSWTPPAPQRSAASLPPDTFLPQG